MRKAMIPAQMPSLPFDQFLKLLSIGQFGAAFAMLTLGFYLHWRAIGGYTMMINDRKSVANQFMLYAILFFFICALGAYLTKAISVNVTVPPLVAGDDTYAPVEIVLVDGRGYLERMQAQEQAQVFKQVRNDATFTISLSKMLQRLNKERLALSTQMSNLPVGEDFGPGAPK